MKPQTNDLPNLPPGYKWEMVHQCQTGMDNPNTGGKWIVRISWTMRGGKHRMLNLKYFYFDTKEAALTLGKQIAEDHAAMRQAKDAGRPTPIKITMSKTAFLCSECGPMPEGGCQHWLDFQKQWDDYFDQR